MYTAEVLITHKYSLIRYGSPFQNAALRQQRAATEVARGPSSRDNSPRQRQRSITKEQRKEELPFIRTIQVCEESDANRTDNVN